MRLYLDACCLSRLTDDQAQPKVREETEAIKRVIERIRHGAIELVVSEALEDEVRRNPSPKRRRIAEAVLALAKASVVVDDAVAGRARVLNNVGYGPFDALHIAAAEAAHADFLLSTDARLIKRAARGIARPRIRLWNPVSWIAEEGL